MFYLFSLYTRTYWKNTLPIIPNAASPKISSDANVFKQTGVFVIATLDISFIYLYIILYILYVIFLGLSLSVCFNFAHNLNVDFRFHGQLTNSKLFKIN